MPTKNFEILSFAPVIIPTLCRYDHFKPCLESLMMCTHADKTEVYIGLDYPTKEEHWEGYKKIKNYLNEIRNNNKFKSLNVIIREKNYGFGPTGNATLLVKEVLKTYDSYIFSEDDNIFSPAFLDYINKGLEKFKNDKSILAINGYRHFYDIKFEKNSFYRQNVDFSAWGYGIWKDRIEEIYSITKKDMKKYLFSLDSLKLRKRNGNNRFLDLIYYAYCPKNQIRITDSFLSVLMFFMRKDVVMPTVSLVRNMGVDGSGENFKNVDKTFEYIHLNQVISANGSYELYGSGKECYEENCQIHKNNSYAKINNWKLLKGILGRIIKILEMKLKGN